MGPTQALYGNGWSCADVAAEIIQTISEQYDDVDDEMLRQKVLDNLRVYYIKEARGESWQNGLTMGMHAKHFIVDDICFYVGSQNLYIADLAEWGIVVDDPQQTQKVMSQYWNPLWKTSYTGKDCDCQEVMDGLGIDRNGGSTHMVDKKTKKLMKQAELA